MDLLDFQKSLKVSGKEATLLRVVDENVRRENLLVVKLSERTGLVYNGVNIGLPLYRKGFSNPVVCLWIPRLQSDMVPAFAD
jgi:hypothetical protein